MGKLFKDKIVGIIGFGAIGQRVGEIARAFGNKIIYYDTVPKNVNWAKPVSLKELLSNADVITLHSSGSEQIICRTEFDLLKPEAMIINTARGGLVDEIELYKRLKSGKIACACLDVFENEPYEGPLKELDNVILTPHIGSYAKEARIEMENMAVDNLLKILNH